MPLERVSREFKDVSMSFQVNPLNYDLIGIKNETAISRSVRNLVLTIQGERFFNQNLGSGVNKLLFETMDELTASSIQNEIETTIKNYEPRVKLSSVDVIPNYDEYQFDIKVVYSIIGIDALPQQLSFALIPTR